MKLGLIWLALCTVGLSLGAGGCAVVDGDEDEDDDADDELVAASESGLGSCPLTPSVGFVEDHYTPPTSPSSLRAKAEAVMPLGAGCPTRFEIVASVWPTGQAQRASRSIRTIDAKQGTAGWMREKLILQGAADLTAYVCTSQSTPRLGNDFSASVVLYTTRNGKKVKLATKRKRFTGFECVRTFDGDPGG